MRLFLDRYASPRLPALFSPLLLVSDEAGLLRAVDFAEGLPRLQDLLRRQYGAVTLAPGPAPKEAAQALVAYFAGSLDAIERVKTATGGTEFQCAVWRALRAIPAGTVLSYGSLAAQLGRPAAGRAVGHANGANPLSIVVPCHRLVGADGSLTGYGGGIERKRWLIEHERRHASRRLTP